MVGAQPLSVARFTQSGLHKVRGEFSLSALAYNLRRVLNIVGMKKLLKKLSMTGREPHQLRHQQGLMTAFGRG